MKKLSRCLALALGVLMALAMAAPAFAADYKKEEVVYANLKNDGLVKLIYVVNSFDTPTPGQISDWGDYSSVLNMTDIGGITLSDGKVAAEANGDRFYYQGYLKTKELPWNISISYTLDGKPVSAEELGGATGTLEISIKTQKNANVNPAFFESYLLQVSVTLSTDVAKNIKTDGGTSANSGSDKLITFAILPNSETTVSVSADVTDFEMGGIQVSAVPYAMNINLPETSELTSEFTDLSDGIAKLNDGVTELKDGIGKLADAGTELKNGSGQFYSGIKKISGGSSGLISGSEAIMGGLNQLNSALNTTDPTQPNLGAMLQLPEGLRKLASGLGQMADALNKLSGGFVEGNAAMKKSVSEIPEINTDFSGLATSDNPLVLLLLDAFAQQQRSLQTIKATYEAVAPAYEAVETQLPVLSGQLTAMSEQLKTTADGIEQAINSDDMLSGLSRLTAGISELNANYQKFHSGLVSYTGGVDSIASGYSELNSGLRDYVGGIDRVEDGVNELSQGTQELANETSNMDEKLEDKIEELLADYDFKEFTPVSFVSPNNGNVESVQFVMMTEGIERPEPVAEPEAPKVEKTFWQKLLALFGL